MANERNAVKAPYNFIPLSRYILQSEHTMDSIPRHDRLDPTLESGEIRLTLTAKTPVFVSDGQEKERTGKALSFYRTPNGDYAIPASSLRGAIRENMQILGLSVFRADEDMDDDTLLFRKMAATNVSIEEKLTAFYQSVINAKPERMNDAEVRAGYLEKQGEKWWIYPAQAVKPATEENPTPRNYLRVSKKMLESNGIHLCDASTQPISYVADEDAVLKLSRTLPDANAKKGMLVCAGRAVGVDYFLKPDGECKEIKLGVSQNPHKIRMDRGVNSVKVSYTVKKNAENLERVQQVFAYAPNRPRVKHGMLMKRPKINTRYIIPPVDKTQERFEVSPLDVLIYKVDFERRKNTLGKNDGFWNLDEKKKQHIFYLRHNGHIFIGKSPFMRIGYLYSLGKGIPENHRNAHDVLDFPSAMLGFAEGENAMRSRVSFGDLKADLKAQEMQPVMMVLGEPSPSYYPAYTIGGKHYNEDRFQIRGYKQYWLKESANPQCMPEKPKVNTIVKPLDKETSFTGVIRFKNLTPVELGLLLLAVRLKTDKTHYHSIGMGKPYGYGRMKLSSMELFCHDWDKFYCFDTLCQPAVKQNTMSQADQIQFYINKYESYVNKCLSEELYCIPQIDDFFYLRSRVICDAEAEQFSYMTLKEYQQTSKSNTSALPTIREIREQEKEAEQKKKREAEEQEKLKQAAESGSYATMKAMLAAKFNSNIGVVSSNKGNQSAKGKNKKKKKR